MLNLNLKLRTQKETFLLEKFTEINFKKAVKYALKVKPVTLTFGPNKDIKTAKKKQKKDRLC